LDTFLVEKRATKETFAVKVVEKESYSEENHPWKADPNLLKKDSGRSCGSQRMGLELIREVKR